MINWQHKVEDKSHIVEPRHDSTGHWVCFKCREPITDNGKAIDNSLKNLPFTGILTANTEQFGLENEGS